MNITIVSVGKLKENSGICLEYSGLSVAQK